jgi:DNA-binding transcriptional MerR regulator
MEFIPKKLYYKIREACEIAGVEAHVLRFWETEFPALAPPKSRKGQRTYRPGDIELILEIRKLLYEDGYTIAGARRQMGMNAPAAKKRALKDNLPDETPAPGNAVITPAPEDEKHPPSEQLRIVQAELENILTFLDRE